MKPETGQVINCDETPHVEAEHIAFGLHVTEAKGPVGVAVMLSPPDDAPLVVYPMKVDEAIRRHKELGETINELYDDGPSLVDEVQIVLRMLDEWAADHGDEAVFFRCRQRLRAAWRKSKGGS